MDLFFFAFRMVSASGLIQIIRMPNTPLRLSIKVFQRLCEYGDMNAKPWWKIVDINWDHYYSVVAIQYNIRLQSEMINEDIPILILWSTNGKP